MTRSVPVALLAVCFIVPAVSSARGDEPTPATIQNFELRDIRNQSVSLDDFREKSAVVVAFLGTECPLATLYAPRLVQLAERFADRGVVFVAIDANAQDSVADLEQFAKTYAISFSLLKDTDGTVADRFRAERTPEVFLLDAQRTVRYRGRIDDQYGVGRQRGKPSREDLARAIEELISGKPVSQPSTETAGCRIGRVRPPRADAQVTFSKRIAPLLNGHCVECHRKGEIGPFALTDYAEVAGWAETIAEAVAADRMPPWHANPEYGHFVNDRRLSPQQKQLIQDWVAGGTPQGDPKDLPEPPQFAEGWRIPRVDQEVFMTEESFDVPAEGTVDYQYFVVDPGFTEDKWVQAAECRPGNRAVVHHIIVGIRGGVGSHKIRQGEIPSEWLTATAPGARPLLLGDGMAKHVPAGSKLVFQMHYTPNGSPQKDRSSVALMFVDGKTVKREVGTLAVDNQRLMILPGAANHKIESWHTFREDTLLLSMFPHMHLRGKDFRYEAIYPDGRTEVLLDVPRYDFGWQNTYELPQPKLLPQGTKLHCTAHFDNSAANPANPNPKALVRWGDQSWDEMMIGYLDMTLADPTKPPSRPRTEKFIAATARQKLAADEPLVELAKGALATNKSFEAFSRAVMQLAPQVDRVCLIVHNGAMVTVQRSTNAPDLRQLDMLRGQSFEAEQLAIPEYAAQQESIVHQNIAGVPTADLQIMAKYLSSSVHVPVHAGPNQATLNFWSRELDAFPPELAELLTSLAKKASD